MKLRIPSVVFVFLILAIFAVFLIQPGIAYWDRILVGKWGMLLVAQSALISVFVGKRIHWSVGGLLFSVCLSAIHRFQWPYSGVDQILAPVLSQGVSARAWPVFQMDHRLLAETAAQRVSAIACVSAVMMAVSLALIRVNELRLSLLALGFCGLVNAILTIYQRLSSSNPLHWGGLIGNPSISSCLTACLLPFFPGRIAFGIGVISVLAVDTSMGILCLLAAGCGALMVRFRYSVFSIAALSGLGIAAISVITWIHPIFTDSNGRFGAWSLAIRMWIEGKKFLLGAGSGTNQALMVIYQAIHKFSTTEGFTQLHNDFVQVLVEQGLFGLACTLAVVISVLYAARKSMTLTASLFGFIAFALGNYPAHLAGPALALSIIATIAFKSKGEING